MIKHIGRHGDRRVAVVFKSVPGEEHMCLVVYPDTLPVAWHDSIMKAIESPPGQQAADLGDVLFRNLLPDGRPILETLHKEGMIKKVQTVQVIMTPTTTSSVRLDELNKILNEMKQGEDAVRRLAELDSNAGLVDPRAKKIQEHMQNTIGALDDDALAVDLTQQADRMESEAKSLLAESARLRKEAAEIRGVEPKKTKRTRKSNKTAAVNEPQ